MVSLHASWSTRRHPKHYVDGKGYNIIFARQPMHQMAPHHYVDGEGYNIILVCQGKHKMTLMLALTNRCTLFLHTIFPMLLPCEHFSRKQFS